MAAAAMATAAGAAVLLYYSGWIGFGPWPCRMATGSPDDLQGEGDDSPSESRGRRRSRTGVGLLRAIEDVPPASPMSARKSSLPKPARPPSTLWESLSTLAEILRFTYSETLGKWPIGDLTFGINYLLRRQGHCEVASVFAGVENIPLSGKEAVAELKELSRFLDVCLHFSKKPFPQFLEVTGFKVEQVLQREGRAGLLRPAFVVLKDEERELVLLVIRGTHSVKDTLTAVTGSVVPFHHTVMDECGVREIKIGYAHCGMVAAARWIAGLALPVLKDVLRQHPTYRIQILGHSLGGGTAALLTYILREKAGLFDTCCVTFAPAACMTWDLAESGLPFVTSVINGCDLVPTFSAASCDDLRAEVTASAWVNDLREQMEKMRILRMVMGGAAALRGHLSSLGAATLQLPGSIGRASKVWYDRSEVGRVARTGVAGAGAFLKPVSNGTQAVALKARTMAEAVVRTGPRLAFSCIRPRKRLSSSGPAFVEDVPPSPIVSLNDDADDNDDVSEHACLVAKDDKLNMRLSLCESAQVVYESESVMGGEERDTAPLASCSFPADVEGTVADVARGVEMSSVVEGRTGGMLGTDEFTRSEEEVRMVEEMVLEREREGEVRMMTGMEDDVYCGSPAAMDELHGYTWKELQAELQLQGDAGAGQSPEEMEMVRNLTQAEEATLFGSEEFSGPASSSNLIISSSSSSSLRDEDCAGPSDWLVDDRRFFPPGRIIHMVCHGTTADRGAHGGAGGTAAEEMEGALGSAAHRCGSYLTSRRLYGRIRLSKTMVRDHYMPMYKQSLEEVIAALESDAAEGRGIESEAESRK